LATLLPLCRFVLPDRLAAHCKLLPLDSKAYASTITLGYCSRISFVSVYTVTDALHTL